MSSSAEIHPVPAGFAGPKTIGPDDYARDYARSVQDPDAFWGEAAKRLHWDRTPTIVRNVSFDPADFRIRWFEDGELNVSVNCLDRHLATNGDKTALIWEADSPDTEARHVSYRELHARVCKLANALRNLGVAKGDRVTIYLPMIVEAAVAMLACARIGAVHSVVFGGFSPNSIADRVGDCGSKLIITADEGLRGGKTVPLKANVDAALKLPGTNTVETVLVVRHTGGAVDMQAPRDRWFHDVVDSQPSTCEPERMNAEDPVTFAPSPGQITYYHAPGGIGTRIDSGVYQGYTIPPFYDSLIGKLIVHGRNRQECLMRLRRALDEIIVDGVKTTLPLFQRLVDNPDIQAGNYDIHWLEHYLAGGAKAG